MNNCHNLKWIKLITRLRLVLSCFREHKFKNNFHEFLNPLCNFSQGIESTTHSFLHCPLFPNKRYILLRTLSIIDCYLLNNTDFVLTQTLLFGNLSFNSKKKKEILNATIDCIKPCNKWYFLATDLIQVINIFCNMTQLIWITVCFWNKILYLSVLCLIAFFVSFINPKYP